MRRPLYALCREVVHGRHFGGRERHHRLMGKQAPGETSEQTAEFSALWALEHQMIPRRTVELIERGLQFIQHLVRVRLITRGNQDADIGLKDGGALFLLHRFYRGLIYVLLAVFLIGSEHPAKLAEHLL